MTYLIKYVPNETEDLNLSIFNMFIGINESKTLTRYVSCKCKYKLDGSKCNPNQKWNNDKCQCECIKHDICQKDQNWNPGILRILRITILLMIQ